MWHCNEKSGFAVFFHGCWNKQKYAICPSSQIPRYFQFHSYHVYAYLGGMWMKLVWKKLSFRQCRYSKKTPTPPHRSWVFLHRVEKKHANCARDYPHANPNIRTYIIYKPIHTTHIEFFIPFARGLDIDPFELIALLTYFFRTLYNKW